MVLAILECLIGLRKKLTNVEAWKGIVIFLGAILKDLRWKIILKSWKKCPQVVKITKPFVRLLEPQDNR